MYVSVFDRPFASLAPEFVTSLSRFFRCGFAKDVFESVLQGFGISKYDTMHRDVDENMTRMADMSIADRTLTVGYVIFLLISSFGDTGVVSYVTRHLHAIDATEMDRKWVYNDDVFEKIYMTHTVPGRSVGCQPRPDLCEWSIDSRMYMLGEGTRRLGDVKNAYTRLFGMNRIMAMASPRGWFCEWAELVRNLALSDPSGMVRAAAAVKHAEYIEFCTDDEQQDMQ
jgi:hypothetical protein